MVLPYMVMSNTLLVEAKKKKCLHHVAKISLEWYMSDDEVAVCLLLCLFVLLCRVSYLFKCFILVL